MYLSKDGSIYVLVRMLDCLIFLYQDERLYRTNYMWSGKGGTGSSRVYWKGAEAAVMPTVRKRQEAVMLIGREWQEAVMPTGTERKEAVMPAGTEG
jgi:hypothetical protein